MEEEKVNGKPELSIVSPVYGCPGVIGELCRRLHAAVQKITENYEIILVEDDSPDDSWQHIVEQCRLDARVIGLRLSRNFGQHYAITAGLEKAQGEWIVVMDCDLQDKPEEIPKLYAKAGEGSDLVLAQRTQRQDTFIKRLSSKFFYRTLGYLTDTTLDNTVANFGIYHRKVITAVLSMHDQIRFFPTMVQWVGFSQTKIPVEHDIRAEGRSSYSLYKLLKLAFNSIVTFSDKPLRMVVNLGMMISLLTALVACFYFVQYLRGRIAVLGYASLILSTWFLGGIIIFILGITGIYLGRIFDQTKKRPCYIIRESTNTHDKN